MIDKEAYNEIIERFLAYKYRQENGILYSFDLSLPEKLVTDYFDMKKTYNLNDKEFIKNYVKNELKFEDMDHNDAQKQGMKNLYHFLVSEDIDSLNFYTLKEFHKKLFEFEKYSECGGEFRRSPAYLKGDPTNLVAWENIYKEALYLNKDIASLEERAKKLKENNSDEEITSFIYDAVKLSADMLLVHPFFDGNGRTIRALTNKLFIEAGIPPIYVTLKEKDEYIKALVNGRETNDYSQLYGFYLYKICDSIVVLDINKYIEEEKETTHENKKESIKEFVKVLKHRRDSMTNVNN